MEARDAAAIEGNVEALLDGMKPGLGMMKALLFHDEWNDMTVEVTVTARGSRNDESITVAKTKTFTVL